MTVSSLTNQISGDQAYLSHPQTESQITEIQKKL